MSGSLGEFVSRRRKELGLRQQEVADALGYTVQAISKFETGLSQMDLATLPALASFLKLSLDDLLKQNDNPSSVPFNGTFNAEYLAHNLAFLRNKAGLTQEEAATLGGVAKRSLANYEKGSSLPPVAALAIYCREYGVSADDIVTKKLEPVVSEPTPVKKGLGLGFKIALMAAALLTVAGVTVGATSPLWAKKDSDSGTSGEETANNISSEGATDGSNTAGSVITTSHEGSSGDNTGVSQSSVSYSGTATHDYGTDTSYSESSFSYGTTSSVSSEMDPALQNQAYFPGLDGVYFLLDGGKINPFDGGTNRLKPGKHTLVITPSPATALNSTDHEIGFSPKASTPEAEVQNGVACVKTDWNTLSITIQDASTDYQGFSRWVSIRRKDNGAWYLFPNYGYSNSTAVLMDVNNPPHQEDPIYQIKTFNIAINGVSYPRMVSLKAGQTYDITPVIDPSTWAAENDNVVLATVEEAFGGNVYHVEAGSTSKAPTITVPADATLGAALKISARIYAKGGGYNRDVDNFLNANIVAA